MKPGTKFKLECEIARNGFVVAGGVALHDEYGICHKADDFEASSISDIREPPEPRKRFVDVDGTEYEILREGETWGGADPVFYHRAVSGFAIALRKVKP